MTFARATFLIANLVDGVVEERHGYADQTLGLHGGRGGWLITHLNTGSLVMRFKAKKADALRVAGLVAALDCWDFVDLDGWRNRMPDLPDKIEAIFAAIGQPRRLIDVPKTDEEREVARAVASLRPNPEALE